VEADAYAGDDESQMHGSDLTPRGCPGPSIPTEYVRGKLYRWVLIWGNNLKEFC